MNLKTSGEHLKKGKIAPVYFLHGEERFELDEATSQIIAAAVNADVKDFNLDIFYGGEIDSGTILDVATSYPMMSDMRAVIVKDVQKLSRIHLDALVKYTYAPVRSTCMVLVAPVGNLKGKPFDEFKKHTVAIEFKTLYDNQILEWIKQYVQSQGREISIEATHLLQTYVGNSKLNLTNELEKMFLNLGNRKQIEAANVQEVVGISKEFTIFHLNNAIGQRNLSRSVLIINELLDHGESPVGIVAGLTRHFSILLKYLYQQQNSKSEKELAQTLGVNPFFLKDYRTHARHFTAKQIHQVFAFLLDADLSLKTSYQTHKMVMELLIYNIVMLR